MIHIENGRFQYPGQRQPVLRGIDLDLRPGSFVGLFGPNGVGKTTMLQLITGLLFLREGTLRVGGFDPARRNPGFLRNLFYLPEEPILPGRTPKGMVNRLGRYYPTFDQTYFQQLLEGFGLAAGAKLSRLSMGQRKQATLAFALACNTPLLLLDEPTNGLDIEAKNRFRDIMINHWSEERLVLISTHQAQDVEKVIDHLLILKGDQLIVDASLNDLQQQLTVTLHQSEPDAGEYLLVDRRPEGWYAVNPRTPEGKDQDISLEVIYRTAMQHPSFFAPAKKPTAL